MTITHRALSFGLIAGVALAAASCTGDRGPEGPPGPPGTSASSSTAGQNLSAALTAARITSDNHLQVDYTLSDAAGNPAPNTNVANSWTGAVMSTDQDSGLPAWQNLTPAAKPITGPYGTTTQPATDQNGKDEVLGDGQFRYTFGSTVPQSASRSSTFRIGLFTRRPLPGVINPAEAPDYDVANAIIDFVPSGGTPQPRELVSTQACNGCHGILEAHGGFRRDVRLCQTCHTTQLFDPDSYDTGNPSQMNPLDLQRLVHRIHRGETLPTVVNAAKANDLTWEFHVIGFRGSDNVYAQVVKNRNPAAAATTPAVPAGVALPQDIRNCAVCHSPGKDAQGNVVAGAQADQWKTSVARRTCQSCHDSSWFADNSPPKYHVLHQQATNPPVPAGTNPPTPAGVTPPGLVQADDSGCRACHSDVLMTQHHTAPNLSSAFNAINLKINSAQASGGVVTVSFSVANGDGTPVTSLAALGLGPSLSLNASGPTTDYQVSVPPPPPVTVNAITTATAGQSPGTWSANMTLPPGASGTWAVGMEARRTNTALTTSERKLGHIGPSSVFYDFAINPVAYFDASGGATATTPRRQVVSIDNCNACHQVLSAHGSLRHNPQYCVLCHAPNATDAPGAGGTTPATGRPAGAPAGTLDLLAARSIHFKVMIHQLHTGEALVLSRPFVIYGFGNSVNFFDEVRFPGTRARCQKCHSGSTFTIDSIPATASPTHSMQWTPATMQDDVLPVTAGGQTMDVLPIAAACMACHDTSAAHAHAQQQTVNFGSTDVSKPATESCAVCHGEGAGFAVSVVHAKAAR